MADKPLESKAVENDFNQNPKKIEKSNVTVKYKVKELTEAAETLFGVKPECVTAAFSIAGKEEATEQEAKRIVKDFMNKEVK